MTINGPPPACAACKFQRTKCSPECLLAPYFPASEAEEFENVHRLFGVSFVKKTLLEFDTQSNREDAIKSIKYEANKHRLEDLLRELKHVTQEMQRVLMQIEDQKTQEMQQAEFVQNQQNQEMGPDVFGSSRQSQEMRPTMFGSNQASSSNAVTTAYMMSDNSFISDKTAPHLSSVDETNNDSISDEDEDEGCI